MTDEAKTGGGAAATWLRRLGLGAGIGVLMAAAFAAFGFYAAPVILKNQALDYIQKTYHRTARLDRVRLNPFTLRFEVDGFSLPDADGSAMISFSRLALRLDLASLPRGELSLKDVVLDHPQIRLVHRADGRVNLADLAPPPSPKPAKPQKPMTVRVENFALDAGAVTLVDQQRKDPLTRRLQAISFRLRGFSTTADGAAVSLSATTDLGESLKWSGDFGLSPVQSSGRIELGAVNIDALKKTLALDLPVATAGGRVDLSGTYAFSLFGGQPDLKLSLQTLTLSDIAIGAKGGAADMVRVAKAAATGAKLDLRRRDLSVARLDVIGAGVRAVLDPRGVNLARLAPPGDPRAAPGPAWTVEAPDIRLSQASLDFTDATPPQPVEISAAPISLEVEGAALPLTKPVALKASAVLDDGAILSAEGQISLPAKPGAAVTGELAVAMDSLQIARFQPYISQSARVRIKGGDVSGKGRLSLLANGGAVYRGGVEIDDLKTADPDLKQDLVTWDALSVEGLDAASKPLAVKIKKVTASGAYARVVLETNYVFNIRAVMDTGETGPRTGTASLDFARFKFDKAGLEKARAVKAATAGLPFPLEIAQIAVENGRMDFTDLTVSPHFSAGIEALNGTMRNLSSAPDSRADIALVGDVGPFAPVTIKGRANFLSATTYTDIGMSFHNMELTTFSPYSGKFAGFRIDKGKLSIDLHYLIDHQKLDATHHVVIDQLQLGDKVDSADAVKLPIKLIVALLKDKNGVIDLPIDISGSLDDPQFKIWPIIWKVVGNVFGKIASAPFTLLGKLVGGGGGEEMGLVVFAPGSSLVALEQSSKIEGLAKALVERPALSVEIPMTQNPELDRPALAEAAFQAALNAAALKAAPKGAKPEAALALFATDRGRRKALEYLYRQGGGQKPVPPKPAGKEEADKVAISWLEGVLRPRYKASDIALQKLGEARAEAVETAMVKASGVDPKRLFVITAPPGAGDKVAMQLQLK